MGILDFLTKTYTTGGARPKALTIKKRERTKFEKKVLEPVAKGLAVTAVGLGAAGIAGGGAGFIAGASRIATAVMPKTISGKVAAGTIGLLAVKSKKVRSAILEAPKKYIEAVDTTAKVIEGEKPIGEGIVEVAKTAGITLGIGALGLGTGLVAKKGYDYLKSRKDKNNIPVTAGTAGSVPVTSGTETAALEETTPLTPETEEISTKKRSYKRRRSKKTPSVRQSVKINIMNKPVGLQMRKYIKEAVYA